jgi:D-alanyl-lipoteichoic acid acyltransferase DltB (MBOAT superfamily)
MFNSNEERKYFLTLLAFAFFLMILSIAEVGIIVVIAALVFLICCFENSVEKMIRWFSFIITFTITVMMCLGIIIFLSTPAENPAPLYSHSADGAHSHNQGMCPVP